jgi:diaminopimelate decarboxylase
VVVTPGLAVEADRRGWPEALTVGPSGCLQLDGVDLAGLAADRGTPLWAVSRSTLESNLDGLLAAFRARYANTEIAYSIKAHNTLAVMRALHLRGAKIDASAEYEVGMALAAGVPAGDIILNGNGKSDAALEAAARLGMRQVNIDSLDEALRLDEIAGRLGTRVRALVRVQLTYADLLANDPSFESTLRIGEGKFGNNVGTGQAMATIEAVVRARNLEFLGLSHHVGFSGYMGEYTPEKELGHHRDANLELARFACEVSAAFGVPIRRLDLGGGFRTGGEVLLSTPGAGADVGFHPVPTADEYADAVFGAIEAELPAARADAPSEERPLIQFETGGWQIANAVVLLARVAEVKDVGPADAPPARRYVVIDGSMMMFVARGMMRVGFPVLLAERPLAPPEPVPVEVVGQTCVYDSVAEDITLPPVARGDLVVLLHQGAYCETESTQFNGFPRPEVVLLDRGRATVVKRRETLDDVQGRDIVPAGLFTGEAPA